MADTDVRDLSSSSNIGCSDRVSGNAPANIYLQPIAAPSILGLFGLAGATFMIAANMAGWYGTNHVLVNLFLFPFAAIFGGVTQLLAAMWAFKARDGVAVAVHGTWGSFFLGYGLLMTMFATGRLGAPGFQFPELGYWFCVTAAISWMCALAAAAENKGMMVTMLWFGAGSTLEAIAMLGGYGAVNLAAAYCFIVGAVVAWYTASALMFEESFGHAVMPAGRARRVRESNIMVGTGEPGVIRGQ